MLYHVIFQLLNRQIFKIAVPAISLACLAPATAAEFSPILKRR
jgi:hypothetical protein